MLKQELKIFNISTDGKELGECILPASYPSAKEALEVGGMLYGTSSLDYSLPSKVCFISSFEVSSLFMSYKSVVLKLSRIGAPATVEINGKTVGVTDNDSFVYTFDVKNYLHFGDNTLTLILNKEGFEADGVRLSPFGIGACELIAYNYALVGTVSVRSELLEEKVRLYIKLDDFDVNAGVRAVATLVSPGGRVYFCGMSGGEGSIDITVPNLWWPRGLGVQNLYKLTVNLYYDNEIVDSKDIKLGLTAVKLNNNGAKFPVIEVNGIEIFTRGACYLPDDAFLPMLSDKRTRALVSSAAALGLNTLVVRDTGVYPNDLFYSLCDAAGILVIHEINLCGDLKTKMREISDNLVAKAYHPSFALVIYTGGEPAEELKALLQDKKHILLDTLDFVLTDIPASVPNVSSLERFVPQNDMNIFGETLELRSTLEDNASLISSLVYKFPRGMSGVVYSTALAAADSIRDKINVIRRRGSSVKHLIMSSFNDTLPMISPALIDAFGKCKGAYYGIRQLFEDVYVGAVNCGTRVTFFVSNETKSEYNGRFEYTVFDAFGKCLFRDGFEVCASALASCDILDVDLVEVVSQRQDSCFVYYRLCDSFLTTSSGTLFFVPSKKFKYQNPELAVDISGCSTDFVLTISSVGYSGRVMISLPSIQATLSDSMFDLTPGGIARVELKTKHAIAIEVLKREIELITLYHLGRD